VKANKRVSPWAVVCVTVFAAFLFAAYFKNSRRSSTPPPGVGKGESLPALLRSDALKGCAVTETEEKRSSIVYTLRCDTWTVIIERMPYLESEAASALIEEGVMNVEALYADALSPYPGDISRKVATDPRFRPQRFKREVAGVQYNYYLLFANERFGYGAMSDDAVKFRSLLGWFYCAEAGEFFRVKYFAPLSTEAHALENSFLALPCK
jgi:hypothetical protein